jgi:homoaconitase/3-isopropylmalate dehydratase large subunit
MKIRDIMTETTAGALAGVATGLGAGDPAASVYYKQDKAKKRKSTMIRRPAMESANQRKSK